MDGFPRLRGECPSPHLLLPVQPAVHHGMVGAQGGAGRLSLELGRPGSVPRQASVGVRSPPLRNGGEGGRRLG